jgi:hypothetical protein
MQNSLLLERRGRAPGWKTRCFSVADVPISIEYCDFDVRGGDNNFGVAVFRFARISIATVLVRVLAELCEFSKNERSCNRAWSDRTIDAGPKSTKIFGPLARFFWGS